MEPDGHGLGKRIRQRNDWQGNGNHGFLSRRKDELGARASRARWLASRQTHLYLGVRRETPRTATGTVALSGHSEAPLCRGHGGAGNFVIASAHGLGGGSNISVFQHGFIYLIIG